MTKHWGGFVCLKKKKITNTESECLQIPQLKTGFLLPTY